MMEVLAAKYAIFTLNKFTELLKNLFKKSKLAPKYKSIKRTFWEWTQVVLGAAHFSFSVLLC